MYEAVELSLRWKHISHRMDSLETVMREERLEKSGSVLARVSEVRLLRAHPE